jgi:hypothetical protein
MSRSKTSLFVTKALLLPKRLPRPRPIVRSQDDGEEREHLLAGDYSAPDAQPLDCLSLPPQLEIGSFTASDLDDATLMQQYAAMAQEQLSSLPFPCRLLGPKDVELLSEHPIAAGRFANLWVGIYEGRKVGLKEYRCYVSFDVDQVVAVRCNRRPYCAYC